MGPKKNKPRSKPYQQAPRKSSRPTKPTYKKKDAGNDPQPEEPTPGDTVQVNQTNQTNPETQSNSQQQTVHVRDDISEAGPSGSPTSDPPNSQVGERVSRSEFDQLKDSLTSIQEMVSSFMFRTQPGANVCPTPQVNNIPVQSTVFQQPSSVPMTQPIVVQPVPSTINDPNFPVPSNINNNPDSMAASMLRQAVSSHINSVTADQAIGKQQDKASYQLDRKISPGLMQDIWEDKYVDLEQLLDNKPDPETPLMLKYVHTNEYGEVIQMVKPKQPKGILSVQHWSYAFDIYMSVYTRKYNLETPNMLTYSNKVKELASKGGDYLRYDEEFRKRRSRFGTPWETPDLELLVECSQAGLQDQVVKILNSLNKTPSSFLPQSPQPTQSNFRPPPPPSDNSVDTPKRIQHPTGACYVFHNGGRCGRTNCRFSHLCYNEGCGQEHAVFACPKNKPRGTQPSPYPGPSIKPTQSRGGFSQSPNTSSAR